ncbi:MULTISPECIES: alkyl hydroperoxide reductase subunit F [Comamonas]|jgi:alkyl hydroperoxide reductase subunit F|uniref:Alkyl hydroperoxide reductase subunit F n=1 Tax=Comamonas terrigena TaxID=32013 RepID=A0A2A7UU03_COMTR|nr:MULTISPECIES: alkyl hydroperoxide reductase subunit F [Comamonas]MBP7351689.1 alkyl hydroperoxide reductase subunit F [Comamonas sp.]MBD9532540.1 alkyl hydroperoxide reductase subunit F [Comamonas sp. CMM01]MDI9855840.1 alkyl hydroperoxide reductase subunit F [Comamonas sp. 17RB]PEH88704.1 alkyl hydroperoxide reductase subunit F [Comamonas terrigena]SUY88382.1 Alkyl hydroperoxide reductase subunit F [Comamonas terrigena]
MLDANLKTQLKAYLERLQKPLEIVATLDDSKAAGEVKSLLADLVALSDKITVVENNDLAVRKPSFAINNPGVETGVRFAGVPLGHEFTSFVLALLHVGGHPSKESADLLEQIKAINVPLHFETYYSLSCHNCPDVVQALNLMSALNPQITHTAIDGGLFQDEVKEREVMGVPTVFVNGERFGQGRMELAEIVAKVDTGAVARAAAQISAKDAFDVLVVGAGPAGAAAAIYAARKGIRTGIAAERVGGQVLDTVDIENFISVSKTDGPKLAAALEAHIRDYEVDIMSQQRAAKLIPAATEGGLIEVQTESGASLKAKTVILSTGARWRNMNVPGEEQYRTKGVTFCPHCDGPLFKGKDVAVIGGGNSGVEAAIDLAGIVKSVTVLEFAAELKADAVLQKKLASLPNVTVILNAQTTEVNGDGKKVTGITYKDRTTDEIKSVALEGIFVQIGLLPNTDWLKGTVNLTRFGEIEINAKGETNVPGVLAAGDCTNVPYKQIIIAAGAGATAALSAFDHLIRH